MFRSTRKGIGGAHFPSAHSGPIRACPGSRQDWTATRPRGAVPLTFRISAGREEEDSNTEVAEMQRGRREDEEGVSPPLLPLSAGKLRRRAGGAAALPGFLPGFRPGGNRENRNAVFTVCEYKRKLTESSFNYFPEGVTKCFIANKRDIGFVSQNGPQIAPTSDAKFWQKTAKFCQNLAKSWQKMAQKGAFRRPNLIKFAEPGGSSQAVKQREMGYFEHA